MTGGLRTSVKGYIIAQRVTGALEINTVHENENETSINVTSNSTAADSADSVDHPPLLSFPETSASYGLNICDGNIPCLPMLSSASECMASYGTTTGAECPPHAVPSTPRTEGEILLFPTLKTFSFSELKRSTRKFHSDNMLGEGGFGCVFKGWVDGNSLTAAKPGTGMVIAVKRLNRQSLKGHKEWMTEINYLGRLRHPNLVKLIGYCTEDDDRLLVYEFMPCGSLNNHLEKCKQQTASVNTRVENVLIIGQHDVSNSFSSSAFQEVSLSLVNSTESASVLRKLIRVVACDQKPQLVFHSKYGWRNSHKREGVPPFAADHYGFRHSACKRSTNRNFTAPQAADSEQETSTDLDSSNSYWLSRFSGSIPCLPILGSASKSRVSNRTRIRAESLPHKVPSTPRTEVEILLKSFFFNELKTATSNFRPDNVVGEGGFGTVFKGWLDQNSLAAAKPGTGIAVGIKRLNQERHQGREEWFTEIYYLGQLRHPNLVKLIGYCSEDNELLLVYEFMPRGSLENHIFRRSSHFQPLSGTVRMKIALGAAKALAFLHNEAKVIHRDFKTSNILLDSTYNVKISDFGLAVDARAFDRHRGAKTRVMGTYGYAAPEYVATGRLTTKCDVYGFGAVMLEMISGKRVFDWNRPPGEQNLVEWAKPYLFSKHRVLQIFDHHIKGQFSAARALKAVYLAFLCLSRDPKLRPNMNNVEKILEKLQESSDMDGLGISQNQRRQNPHVSSINGPK